MTGGYVLTIAFQGKPGGSELPVIMIGDEECTSVLSTSSGYSCTVPPGYGRSHAVSLKFTNMPLETCPKLFSYNDPIIGEVFPMRIPQGAAVTVTITGSFSPATVPVVPVVTLIAGANNYVIPLDTVRGPSKLLALMPASLPSGTYNLNVTVGAVPAVIANFIVREASPPFMVTMNTYSDPSDFTVSQRNNFMAIVADMLQEQPSAIYISAVLAGSIIVKFVLLTADNTNSVKTLTTKIESGVFKQYIPGTQTVTIGGEPIAVGEIGTPSPADNDNKIPGYAIALIVIFIVLGLLVGLVLWIKVRRRRRRELPLQVVERRDTNMI